MAGAYGKPKLTYRGRMDRHDDEVWLIWSNKWGCWYRPESAGYTKDIAQAGLYSKEAAARHYDGHESPRSHRDTEPFPISAVRAHIDAVERETISRHAAELASIARLRAALPQAPTP